MVHKEGSEKNGTTFLVAAAAFVVVIGGMRAASPVIVPFLISLFLAIICAVPQRWLISRKVPVALATVIVVIGFLAVVFFTGKLAGGSIDDFIRSAPSYQARFKAEAEKAVTFLQERGYDTSGEFILEYFDPSYTITFASRVLSATTGLLADAFLIVVVMIFILLEMSSLSQRLVKASGEDENSRNRLETLSAGVRRYLLIKAIISVLTAFILWGWLHYLGVSYAQLWGITVFFMNFVPNIGSVLAGLPPVVIGLIEGGPGVGFAVLSGYLFVNIIIGNFVEPRYMGHGLGMSTLVVFLSLAFWGWVLGPVGMLLSVPLTLVCKIALESTDDLRWVALLIGDMTEVE